jgi:7-carboxy-7-deazaguanine synthase
MSKRYAINEIFYSLQGEGVRAGTAATFIRFAGCNRKCRKEPGPRSIGGFNCDTDYRLRRRLTATEVVNAAIRPSDKLPGYPLWCVLTGGEPGLQLDGELIYELHQAGFRIAVETNGTIALPSNVDWVTVSPKVHDLEVKQKFADEVKFVLVDQQPIPRTSIRASHYLLSPAFKGRVIDVGALAWCIRLVKSNPKWRLSCQQHKWWVVP